MRLLLFVPLRHSSAEDKSRKGQRNMSTYKFALQGMHDNRPRELQGSCGHSVKEI
jgi:hypothetical protein